MRVIVTLACTETGDRNYTTTKKQKRIKPDDWKCANIVRVSKDTPYIGKPDKHISLTYQKCLYIINVRLISGFRIGKRGNQCNWGESCNDVGNHLSRARQLTSSAGDGSSFYMH